MFANSGLYKSMIESGDDAKEVEKALINQINKNGWCNLMDISSMMSMISSPGGGLVGNYVFHCKMSGRDMEVINVIHIAMFLDMGKDRIKQLLEEVIPYTIKHRSFHGIYGVINSVDEYIWECYKKKGLDGLLFSFGYQKGFIFENVETIYSLKRALFPEQEIMKELTRLEEEIYKQRSSNDSSNLHKISDLYGIPPKRKK